jgi:trehalose 6-phosphate synthase
MSRLVIVSNRLPVTIRNANQIDQVEVSSGGLVTALRSIVRRHEGHWIGWAGTDHNPLIEEHLRNSVAFENCRMVPVFLSPEERREFYQGFCNEILWPLFHDLQSRCNFEPSYWVRYQRVNARFADAVCSVAKPDDVVWVHDYHLMLLGELLLQRLPREKVVYFHHIPFPPLDVFEKLPWRLQVLRSLLSFGCVGFQTDRDRRNFLACVRRFLPHARARHTGEQLFVEQGDTRTLLATFPIGIDFDEFADMAANPEVEHQADLMRANLKGCRVVLGVDRLDYTKGIPERLKAFRKLLEKHPELYRKVSLIQVVVPSREEIPKYQELKIQIERLVSQINGHFGGPSWVPVHYLHRHLSRAELVAYYRAADVALVTPLKDGMNLVAKEFCASKVDDKGVLVLSEFAGSANQLRGGALLVNPYDTETVASVLYQALHMSEPEMRSGMDRMRQKIRTENVYRWCEQFFHEAKGGTHIPHPAQIEAPIEMAHAEHMTQEM